MVLDWSGQGSALTGVGDTGSGVIKFNITKTPQGYSVGVYSGQNLLATEAFSTIEEAKAWADQSFAQIPAPSAQSPSEVVAQEPTPIARVSEPTAQPVLPVESSQPSTNPVMRNSGLTTSKIAAASLGGQQPVSTPRRLM